MGSGGELHSNLFYGGIVDSTHTAQADAVVAELELLEERAEVRVERVPIGAVIVRREVEQRIEKLEVALTRETLVVRLESTAQDSSVIQDSSAGQVMVDGVPLKPGEEVRLVVYDERVVSTVTPMVAQTVRVVRSSVSEQRTLEVDLRREVLKVDTEGEVRVHER
jgi:uncharacterized protein (TIGR02271 family)